MSEQPNPRSTDAEVSRETFEDRERSQRFQVEILKALHHTWHENYWSAARLLGQTWALYMAIVAALVGYVFTQSMSPQLHASILLIAFLVSLLYFVGFLYWGWELHRLVRLLEDLTKRLDPLLFDELALETAFRRWRALQVFGALNCAAILIVLGIGLACMAR